MSNLRLYSPHYPKFHLIHRSSVILLPPLVEKRKCPLPNHLKLFPAPDRQTYQQPAIPRARHRTRQTDLSAASHTKHLPSTLISPHHSYLLTSFIININVKPFIGEHHTPLDLLLEK